MILCINTCKLFGGDLYLFCVLLLLKWEMIQFDPMWLLFYSTELKPAHTLPTYIDKHMLVWSMTRPQNGRKSVGARDTTIRSLAILAVDNPRIWYVFGWLNYHQTFLAEKKLFRRLKLGRPSLPGNNQLRNVPCLRCKLQHSVSTIENIENTKRLRGDGLTDLWLFIVAYIVHDSLVSQVWCFEDLMVSPVGSFMEISNPTEDSLPKWHLGSFSFADASWVRFTEGVSWQRLLQLWTFGRGSQV